MILFYDSLYVSRMNHHKHIYFCSLVVHYYSYLLQTIASPKQMNDILDYLLAFTATERHLLKLWTSWPGMKVCILPAASNSSDNGSDKVRHPQKTSLFMMRSWVASGSKNCCVQNPQNEFEKDMDKNISQQQLIPDIYEITLEMLTGSYIGSDTFIGLYFSGRCQHLDI